MRKRAEQVDETRQRIVAATVHLHEHLGPAATTVAAIAEQAGVTRLTVYRHFPDDVALFTACSTDWMSRQVPPDPDAWASVPDPVERLRAGLTDLYRYYRQGESMLSKVYGDKVALPEPIRRSLEREEQEARDLLLKPFGTSGARRRRLRGVLGHAVSFWTWRSLCVDHGLSNREAVEAMVALVRCTD